jgi:hypothetical protein
MAAFSETNFGNLLPMGLSRIAVVFSCVILAGCAYLSNGSTPIASWSGKRPIDDAVDCVKRALDYDFRSGRALLPDITHHVDTVEQGRVYDISPAVGPYHARVRSDGPDVTTVELFMPSMIYNAQVRDSLAKCP